MFGRVEGRRLVPYWRRAEIDAGRLAGRGLELAWARDPVDVFFMEIQGSGTLRFPDGQEQRVGYAGANGRAYRAIGRLLIDEGHVPREAMSMQAIRAWLAAHPEERQRVLQHNESYVFFRPLAGPPEGSLGRPLTPGRSIATDARLFPPGSPRLPRHRAARAGARRLGPVDSALALRPEPGHRRGDPGRRAGRLLLGARGARRLRGGADAAAGAALLPGGPTDGSHAPRVSSTDPLTASGRPAPARGELLRLSAGGVRSVQAPCAQSTRAIQMKGDLPRIAPRGAGPFTERG